MGSPTTTRTWDTAVNSRLLCRLSYRGSANPPIVGHLPANLANRILLSSEGCWLFTGAKQSRGYGSVGIGNRRTALAHRVAYEACVGPIPDGMTIDHLCLNKTCLNPEHMEVVSRAENTSRAHRGTGRCYCDDCPTCRERLRSARRRASA